MRLLTRLSVDRIGSERSFFFEVLFQFGNRNPNLLHRVAVADSDAAVVFRVEIVGDAERRTDFILTTVTLADRTGIIEVNREFFGQQVEHLAGFFRELLGQWQIGCCPSA